MKDGDKRRRGLNLSPFQRHKKEWEDCDKCSLCSVRNKVVQFKGKIPCDVLFVGEAPGMSEDEDGKPFVGPAGILLQKIVNNASRGYDLRIGYTNLIACIPLDEEGDKVDRPPVESILECKPRLEELIRLAKPGLIVMVGKDPEQWLEKGMKDSVKYDKSIETVRIDHPAYILRSGGSMVNMLSKRAESLLSDAFYDLKEGDD